MNIQVPTSSTGRSGWDIQREITGLVNPAITADCQGRPEAFGRYGFGPR